MKCATPTWEPVYAIAMNTLGKHNAMSGRPRRYPLQQMTNIQTRSRNQERGQVNASQTRNTLNANVADMPKGQAAFKANMVLEGRPVGCPSRLASPCRCSGILWFTQAFSPQQRRPPLPPLPEWRFPVPNQDESEVPWWYPTMGVMPWSPLQGHSDSPGNDPEILGIC